MGRKATAKWMRRAPQFEARAGAPLWRLLRRMVRAARKWPRTGTAIMLEMEAMERNPRLPRYLVRAKLHVALRWKR